MPQPEPTSSSGSPLPPAVLTPAGQERSPRRSVAATNRTTVTAKIRRPAAAVGTQLWMGIFVVVLSFVAAEVQDFEILLPPTDMYVHFADGYLRGPGASIDLTQLLFTAVSESGPATMAAGGGGDGMDDDGGVDDFYSNEAGEGETEGAGGAGTPPRRRLDGGVDVSGSTWIDIVSFLLPSRCANAKKGCDWTDLGVGAKVDSDLRWCCTEAAVQMGMCEGGDKLGRLIIDEDIFQGEARSVSVPNEGPVKKKLKNDFFEFEQTGRYVVVFANCNELGREVKVEGEAIWHSAHGYLPGELFGFMYFYTLLFAVYVLLFLWYAGLMKANASSRIPIEKWILGTISVGLMELTFLTLNYWERNADGRAHMWSTYVAIIMGVFKHGISRCLLVMVSLGWGVIRDTLGSALHKVVILGAVYIGTAGMRDIMVIWAVEDIATLSYNQEDELWNVATILTFVVGTCEDAGAGDCPYG